MSPAAGDTRRTGANDRCKGCSGGRTGHTPAPGESRSAALLSNPIVIVGHRLQFNPPVADVKWHFLLFRSENWNFPVMAACGQILASTASSTLILPGGMGVWEG